MPRTPAKVTQGELSPTSPLSLDEAARLLLRGLVTASTLRAAASRGDLAVEKIGRRVVTTPADVAAWREKCRDQQKARVSICEQPAGSYRRNGSSETDSGNLARDAAREIARKLKQGSQNTSATNTSRGAASVHYLKSGSRT